MKWKDKRIREKFYIRLKKIEDRLNEWCSTEIEYDGVLNVLRDLFSQASRINGPKYIFNDRLILTNPRKTIPFDYFKFSMFVKKDGNIEIEIVVVDSDRKPIKINI